MAGNTTAVVRFSWPFMVGATFLTGGRPTVDQLSVSPPAPGFTWDGTTVTGLTNGVTYTFGVVTSNECGSSQSFGRSWEYTPGVAPTWVKATPVTVATKGNYSAKFEATGDPVPTYRLVTTEPWLKIEPNGRVSGSPPCWHEVVHLLGRSEQRRRHVLHPVHGHHRRPVHRDRALAAEVVARAAMSHSGRVVVLPDLEPMLATTGIPLGGLTGGRSNRSGRVGVPESREGQEAWVLSVLLRGERCAELTRHRRSAHEPRI
jgi:hypothetical protein